MKQLVVPSSLAMHVISLAHDVLLSGHLGVTKTVRRILCVFFVPKLWQLVRSYVSSCDICQMTSDRGGCGKAPLQKVPIVSETFEKVGIDLVGPLPVTDRKNRYILTVVDYATRYVSAKALQNIDTLTVAEALFSIYSQVGIPKVVLSDFGTQFVSDLAQAIDGLMGISRQHSSVYHPAGNGLTEKFNGIIKKCLRKLSAGFPTEWDRYLDATLFAIRESKQEALGFSSFELMYGREVRGPLKVLQELWAKDFVDTKTKTSYQFVIDLKNKLKTTLGLAHDNLLTSQSTVKTKYDKNTKLRTFEIGDKVMILRPSDSNKLVMLWQGPYKVEDKFGNVNYQLKIKNKLTIYHVNLLKKYNERTPLNNEARSVAFINQLGCNENVCTDDLLDTPVTVAVVSVVDLVAEEPEGISIEPPPSIGQATESYQDVKVNPDLSKVQKQQLNSLLLEFSSIFSDLPGETDIETHQLS